MEPTYTVSARIKRPASEVFEAILDPAKLTQYFVDRVSSRLEAGERVIFGWDGWGDYPITVVDVVQNERVVFRLNTIEWKKSESDSYDVTVTIELEATDEGHTVVKISESGWKRDADGLRASHDNCGGWQSMALGLKAWLEHGIDLR